MGFEKIVKRIEDNFSSPPEEKNDAGIDYPAEVRGAIEEYFSNCNEEMQNYKDLALETVKEADYNLNQLLQLLVEEGYAEDQHTLKVGHAIISASRLGDEREFTDDIADSEGGWKRWNAHQALTGAWCRKQGPQVLGIFYRNHAVEVSLFDDREKMSQYLDLPLGGRNLIVGVGPSSHNLFPQITLKPNFKENILSSWENWEEEEDYFAGPLGEIIGAVEGKYFFYRSASERHSYYLDFERGRVVSPLSGLTGLNFSGAELSSEVF